MSGTGCGYSGCLVIVAKSRYGIGRSGVLAPLTNLTGVAGSGTGRSDYGFNVGVILYCNFGFVGILTAGTGVYGTALSGTGGILNAANRPGVSGCCGVIGRFNDSARGTGLGGISALGTGGRSYYGVVGMLTSCATGGTYAVFHGMLAGSGKSGSITYGTGLCLTAGRSLDVPDMSSGNDIGLVAVITT